ncbi:MAG: hypothetical protein KA010_02545 [Saprospiraceae bacterium]|nr:hypothetical protein [Saprospiraceae bacterium]
MLLAFSAGLYAQQPPPNPKANKQRKADKIESLRIAFITDKLELTPEESQRFWPLYREYSDKQHALKKEGRMSMKDLDNMSDSEAERMAENHLEIQRKSDILKEEYYKKFKMVLPIKKVIKLQQAEREFKQMLMERMQKGKENRRDNMQRPPLPPNGGDPSDED